MATRPRNRLFLTALCLTQALLSVSSQEGAYARHYYSARSTKHSSVRKAIAPLPKALESKSADKLIEYMSTTWLNRRPNLAHSQVGVEVMSLPDGAVLFTSNGTRRFTPASTTKVFTTGCAFDQLGGNYRYKTKLVTQGIVEGGELEGDILIAPSQDPSMSRDDLTNLFAQLGKETPNRSAVKKITGSLSLSTTGGGIDYFQPGWLAEDWGQAWMPVSSNLVIDRNIAAASGAITGVKSLPGTDTSALTRGILSNDNDSAWITYHPESSSEVFYVPEATKANANGGRQRPFVVANPSLYNLALAKSICSSLGVHIGSNQPPEDAIEAKTVLAEHQSKPLSEIIKWTLHESDNLYAQQLLRTLGLNSSATPQANYHPVTLEDRGQVALSNWLSAIGVPSDQAILFDGCGLCRKNVVTPHALNLTLRYLAGANVNGPYLELMRSESGKGGKGSYRFKTGAMDNVRTITGVLVTAGGDNLAVTIMVSGHIPQVRDLRITFFDLIQSLQAIDKKLGTAPKAQAPSKAAR